MNVSGDDRKEEKVARRLIEELKNGTPSKKEFAKMKYRVAREESLGRVMRDHEIIKFLRSHEADLIKTLRGKEVRAASGIYTVAVMTKPCKCPKEKPCLYCPGGVDSGTPQSYLGNEPALMRGLQVGFDPYQQVRYRLSQYETIGHKPSKVQLIIMGGTFPATDLDYQEWFVTRCLKAMNDYPNDSQGGWEYLEDAQRKNESAKVRCIGITMETRPDWARAPQVDRMIKLGATLVEVGVQAIDDEILKGVNRGSCVKDAAEATRTLRDCGFKVGYHMMPGLPGSSKVKDLESMRRIFEDEDFKPDYLKIYPTLVIEGTGLSQMWRDGAYRALSNEDATDIIIEAAMHFPKWVRVSRIQRDVPANIILDGVKKSNLRELVESGIKSRGMKCKCIRCREVGLAKIRGLKTADLKPKLTVETYEAGGGTEEFISAEDPQKDLLIGFIRLRVPSEKAHRPEVKGAAVIRELHVYGQQVPIGESAKTGYQHQGWGSTLLQKAEKLTLEKYGLRRIVVLPGVGVRGYYRQREYRKWKSSPFMAKDL